MSEAEEGADPLQHVEDPGEYNQRLRLQEISQARKSARTALGAEAQQVYGEEWETVAYREVQALVRELEWLIRDQGDDEYFTKELGRIEFTPPSVEELSQKEGFEAHRLIGEKPKTKQMSVYGLFSTEKTGAGFVDLPTNLTQTWTMNVLTQHSGPTEVKTRVQRSVPLKVTKNAERLCRKFINEAGLDARLEDEDPHGEL